MSWAGSPIDCTVAMTARLETVMKTFLILSFFVAFVAPVFFSRGLQKFATDPVRPEAPQQNELPESQGALKSA